MASVQVGPLIRPVITYEELCLMPPDGNRYELFDGEVYMSPSPNRRHQTLLGRLYLVFTAAIVDRTQVLFAPMDVVLAPTTALQPDLILVLERNSRILKDVVRGAPDLVIEVLSPSTAKKDHGMKMETYARHGISEYWIVDGDTETIEIYYLDHDAKAYRLTQTCHPGELATTPLLPKLSVDIAKLFDE